MFLNARFVKCILHINVRSNVTPMYFGFGLIADLGIFCQIVFNQEHMPLKELTKRRKEAYLITKTTSRLDKIYRVFRICEQWKEFGRSNGKYLPKNLNLICLRTDESIETYLESKEGSSVNPHLHTKKSPNHINKIKQTMKNNVTIEEENIYNGKGGIEWNTKRIN